MFLFEQLKTCAIKRRSNAHKNNIASAGNRTRINCLEGSYADHYTTDAHPARSGSSPRPRFGQNPPWTAKGSVVGSLWEPQDGQLQLSNRQLLPHVPKLSFQPKRGRSFGLPGGPTES